MQPRNASSTRRISCDSARPSRPTTGSRSSTLVGLSCLSFLSTPFPALLMLCATPAHTTALDSQPGLDMLVWRFFVGHKIRTPRDVVVLLHELRSSQECWNKAGGGKIGQSGDGSQSKEGSGEGGEAAAAATSTAPTQQASVQESDGDGDSDKMCSMESVRKLLNPEQVELRERHEKTSLRVLTFGVLVKSVSLSLLTIFILHSSFFILHSTPLLLSSRPLHSHCHNLSESRISAYALAKLGKRNPSCLAEAGKARDWTRHTSHISASSSDWG